MYEIEGKYVNIWENVTIEDYPGVRGEYEINDHRRKTSLFRMIVLSARRYSA